MGINFRKDTLKSVARNSIPTPNTHIMKIKIGYSTNEINIDVPAGTTVDQIRRNANYRAVLGFPESVVAKSGPVTLPNETVLSDGSSVVFETACQSKAS